MVKKSTKNTNVKTTKTSIKKLLEQKIKPLVQMDGGDIEMVDFDVKKKVVKVRLTGACVGCPLAGITLKMGVEIEIKNQFPDVEEVIAID